MLMNLDSIQLANSHWVLQSSELCHTTQQHVLWKEVIVFTHRPLWFVVRFLKSSSFFLFCTSVIGNQLDSLWWWASTLSTIHLCHFMMLCICMPYKYTMPYDPPCKLELLWPWVTASHLHLYSHDTTGDSHMIVCELHWLLLSWMNLGLTATPYDCFPSPCQVQHISIVTSFVRPFTLFSNSCT